MAVKEKKKKPQVEYEKQPESPTKKFDVTYAIVSVIAIIVLFSVLVTAYYKNNYIMFSPENVAEQYVENTAENDGYDALKYTVLIKNTKFGNFISENYMDKYIDENATAPAMTAEEEGEKLTLLLDRMYPVFTDLVDLYGFENYDKLFSEYFAAYVPCYEEIYGNKAFTTDDMFSALEGNLGTYMDEYAYNCEVLYGKGKEYADYYLGKNKAVLSDDDEKYSAGYTITADTSLVREYDDDEVKAYTSSLTSGQKAAYEHFGISANDISAVAEVKTVKVLSGVGDKDAIAQKNVEFAEHPEIITLVKIGHQWYVDFTADID